MGARMTYLRRFLLDEARAARRASSQSKAAILLAAHRFAKEDGLEGDAYDRALDAVAKAMAEQEDAR